MYPFLIVFYPLIFQFSFYILNHKHNNWIYFNVKRFKDYGQNLETTTSECYRKKKKSPNLSFLNARQHQTEKIKIKV